MLKISIRHNDVGIITQAANIERDEHGLAAMESVIPSSKTIDVINDVIIDEGTVRNGLPHERLRLSIDRVASNEDNDAVANELDSIIRYLDQVPDHYHVRSIDLRPDNMHFEVTYVEDESR